MMNFVQLIFLKKRPYNNLNIRIKSVWFELLVHKFRCMRNKVRVSDILVKK
jgi:hypothetical protein